VWNKALFPGHRKVAWMSRRSVREYAGFLDWLSRLDDTPCDVIDLTEVKIPHGPEHGSSRPPSLAVSVAWLNPSTIRDNKLWDLAKPLEITERRRYLELWRQLRSENAALRVTDGDELMSAPISLFDELLMSCVTDNWQNVSRIFGDTFMSLMDDIAWPSDVFLTTRVNALVKDGRLEIRGNSERLFGEVRLPRAGG
jgi:hypothetical protein